MARLEWLTARPIAHRGFHDMNQSVYENTLSAFERAVAADFAIECDLQYVADCVPVVFHDGTLKRLCTIDGDVRSKLSSELAQLSIGGTADRIPTFARMLEAVAGRVPLVIELKGREGDDEGFAATVLDMLEGYDGKVALMSFNAWLLKDLKDLDAPYPLGLTADGTSPEALARHEEVMGYGLDFISYCIHHLPNPFVDGLRSRGIPVITWTVREQAEREATERYGDQMTFEGFDPRELVA